MKREKISEIIGEIDEKYIDEATDFAALKEQDFNMVKAENNTKRFKWSAAAACVLAVFVLSLTGISIAAEAMEYNNAVAFFEENGLSVENLSRADIKAVYRDITTKSFTYDKTAKIITKAVPGLEITQDEPTPEELKQIWDRTIKPRPISKTGISYRFDYKYVPNEALGFEVFEKSILQCYKDGKLSWETEFYDFSLDGSVYTSFGTAAWGDNMISSNTSKPVCPYIVRLDESGNTIWQKQIDHGFNMESVWAVLDNGDGTWALISRGDLKYLCLTLFDVDGNELSFKKTEVGNLGIWNAARLGDGYIVQMGNTAAGDTGLILKMDREGNLLGNFKYGGEDSDYYITDMIEFGGDIYLSAYAVPKQKDEGGRHEIANILDYAFKDNNWRDIPSEELTPIVRDNYTAVLLTCDSSGGEPKTFYSVKGSLGGKLTVNSSGQLEWDAESITSTFISPYTNAFTVGGDCKVYRYTFDTSGKLVNREDTGETVQYRR